MDEKKITQILESFDVPLEKIDEIVLVMLKEAEQGKVQRTISEKEEFITRSHLQHLIDNEPDWRKKALIAGYFFGKIV